MFASVLVSGCGDKKDPTEPEGAYNQFREALFQGDAEVVWNRLAPTSHQYFEDQYQRLVQMDETIRRYLPQTDHKLARKQAGSVLTDEVSNGKELFMELFAPDTLEVDESHRVGATVEEIVISEDGNTARIKTLGGQEYIVTRGEDEEWYVNLIQSSEDAVRNLAWLEQNESALEQTVEELIEEEREQREQVIAELMDPSGKE